MFCCPQCTASQEAKLNKSGIFVVSRLALSVKSYGFASSPKVGAFGSPRKVHLSAKASPFGRGVTVGDGEGEPAFRHDPSRENGIPERPQTLRYSEIINIFSLAYAQSASGGHSKSSSPESGTALNGNCRRSRPCRRGRHESRSCGSPRGRGGCSGRWGQRPACRQGKPPQRCRPRR